MEEKIMELTDSLNKAIVAGSNMYIQGKVETVKEIIQTIDSEIITSNKTNYITNSSIGNITVTVNIIKKWWMEYRKVLMERYEIKEFPMGEE